MPTETIIKTRPIMKPHWGNLSIRFDLYKLTGKWAYGGEVYIGDARLHKGNVVEAVIINQEAVIDGTIQSGNYYMVTDDLPELAKCRNYTDFTKRIFMPHVLTTFPKKDVLKAQKPELIATEEYPEQVEVIPE